MNKETKGLKKLRKNTANNKPKYHCENCNCHRYSPCTCQKKGKK